MAKKKTEELEETAATEEVVETVEEAGIEAAADVDAESAEAEVVEAPVVETRQSKSETAESTSDEGDAPAHKGKRAEKIGVVTSDKMTLTVVVRVDRLVKHPIYRKYVRKRKKFMAHDDKGAKIGDKVRIVETRPLSARKRWRVVEIIQKAEL